jgi:hypothetical protein
LKFVGPLDRRSDGPPQELAFDVLSLKGIKNSLLLSDVPVVWDHQNEVSCERWI